MTGGVDDDLQRHDHHQYSDQLQPPFQDLQQQYGGEHLYYEAQDEEALASSPRASVGVVTLGDIARLKGLGDAPPPAMPVPAKADHAGVEAMTRYGEDVAPFATASTTRQVMADGWGG